MTEEDRSQVKILFGPKGLPRQRNRALDHVLPDTDIVAFFDDDYVPTHHALEGLARAFDAFPDAAGLTGRLLGDGILGPGIALEDAVKMVRDWEQCEGAQAHEQPPKVLAELRGLYGCNMAYRADAVRDLRFDERLPLYAWQEDIDFAVRTPGKMLRTDAMVGVHCGVKSGREKRGDMLGYSQIANPFYLWRKGSMTGRFALKLSARNMLSNHARAFTPEPWIDRRGRLRGNWRAIADMIRGRLDPERILAL